MLVDVGVGMCKMCIYLCGRAFELAFVLCTFTVLFMNKLDHDSSSLGIALHLVRAPSTLHMEVIHQYHYNATQHNTDWSNAEA